MTSPKFRIVAAAGAIALSACAFTEETLWPSLTGEDPAGKKKNESAQAKAPPPAPQPPVVIAASPQPPLGTSDFQPPGVTSGSPTGTLVGKKVVELRAELQRLQATISLHNNQLQQLRAKVVQDSQRYHGTVAAVNARLQVGTTPGNPILVQQFNNAQGDLERLSQDIAEMNKLAGGIGDDSSLSGYLSEAARAAFSVSGAVDEDHRQLAILEDEVNRTVVLIDRLLKEVADDVRRQTAYVGTERSNLNMMSAGIKTGEIYGASLINQAMASAGAGRDGNVAGAAQDIGARRPLVVIRFDRANVPYQQALYAAVSKVLERRPDATFDLVGVAPAGSGTGREAVNTNKARRHADDVLRSLVEMGLPPVRVAVTTRVLPAAKNNEVHLYLR